MESCTTKRRRESEERQTCKRIKDEHGMPKPLEAPMVCSIPFQLPEPVEQRDLLPALKHCYDHCQKGLFAVQTSHLPEPNLSRVLSGYCPAGFEALFPSGCTEAYARERAKNEVLRVQAKTLESKIAALEASYQAYQAQAKSHLSELNHSFELHLSQRKLTLEKTDHDTIQLLELQRMYNRISGLNIVQLNDHQFRCKLRAQQNELIFKVAEEADQSLDVTLVSYTVSGERIPQHFKEGLELTPRQEPVLLEQFFACLL